MVAGIMGARAWRMVFPSQRTFFTVQQYNPASYPFVVPWFWKFRAEVQGGGGGTSSFAGVSNSNIPNWFNWPPPMSGNGMNNWTTADYTLNQSPLLPGSSQTAVVAQGSVSNTYVDSGAVVLTWS